MKTIILMLIGALSLSWGSVQAKTPLKGLGYGIKGGGYFFYPGDPIPTLTGGVFADWSLPARWQPATVGKVVIGGDILYAFCNITSDNNRYHELHFRPKVGFDFRANKQKKHFWHWLFPSTSDAPHFWQWFIPAVSYAPHFCMELFPYTGQYSVGWLGGCATWQLPYRMQLEVDVGKTVGYEWDLSDGWYFKVTLGHRWLAV